MVQDNRISERLIALFLLGAFLLLPPVLLVFNMPARALGVPVLYLYIFVVWAVLIALAAAIARLLAREGPVPGEVADLAATEVPGAAERARDA